MEPFSSATDCARRRVALLLSVMGALAVNAGTMHAQRVRTDQERNQPVRSVLAPATADSLYQRARELLNRRELDAAAELFDRVAREAPQSRVAPNALYWRAYALYQRYGMNSDSTFLSKARATLVDHVEQYPWSSTKIDALELLDRVNTARSAAGDPSSRQNMARQRDGSREWVGCVTTPSGAIAARGTPEGSRFEGPDSVIAGALSGDLLVAVMKGFSSGAGLCADLSRYTPLYWKLTQFDQKDMLIRVFGRSLHASATAALRDIVNRESNDRLRKHAKEWLDLR